MKRIKNKDIHKINMAIRFFKHDAHNKSMPGEKAQTKEDMNKNKNKQSQIAKELNKPLEENKPTQSNKSKKSILSYIPKRVRMALSIAIVAGVSLFLPKPAYALDPLEIPTGAESFLVQKEYSYYSTEPDIDSCKLALFYIDNSGEAHPFAEQGYFVTNSEDTLWTSTRDSIPGEGAYEGLTYWIVKVKGVKVKPSERDSIGGTYHSEPEDRLLVNG